jgi:uncharacterized protein (TIGR03066 family)
MNVSRFLTACIIALVGLPCALADDKKEKPIYAKLIVGKWEVTKTYDETHAPIGTVYEFNRTGSLKITCKRDGEEDIADGTYKVEKEKLLLTVDKDEKDPVTIKEITDQKLVVAVTTKEIIELKRLK